MSSSIIAKRSIVIGGHKTSLSMEKKFWEGFKRIAREEDKTLSELAEIVEARGLNETNLSSAIRLFCYERELERSALLAAQVAIHVAGATAYVGA